MNFIILFLREGLKISETCNRADGKGGRYESARVPPPMPSATLKINPPQMYLDYNYNQIGASNFKDPPKSQSENCQKNHIRKF